MEDSNVLNPGLEAQGAVLGEYSARKGMKQRGMDKTAQ
jgi:hypothetical protein